MNVLNRRQLRKIIQESLSESLTYGEKLQSNYIKEISSVRRKFLKAKESLQEFADFANEAAFLDSPDAKAFMAKVNLAEQSFENTLSLLTDAEEIMSNLSWNEIHSEEL